MEPFKGTPSRKPLQKENSTGTVQGNRVQLTPTGKLICGISWYLLGDPTRTPMGDPSSETAPLDPLDDPLQCTPTRGQPPDDFHGTPTRRPLHETPSRGPPLWKPL
jgi:hypothetical protein